MNKSILNIENQEFINNNLEKDIAQLLFQKHSSITVDIKLLIEQIEAKKRSKNKLVSWFNTSSIIYPNKLNIEQTSSEFTADFKAKLISGNNLIDITGGFGVDSYYFSKYFDSVIHCEIDRDLSELVKHNYNQLQATNIECLNTNGIEFLKKTKINFDWIYVDPSRRHESKGKVFFLNDCLPNIPKHLDLLFSKSNNVLIKTSPLLDISIGITELNYVKSIYVIAVNNEVKELLWILEKDFKELIEIRTINLKKNGEDSFTFKMSEESTCEVTYNQPLTYLYEPNSAILKAGAFNILAVKLNVYKLQKHSHLYTSDNLISFPGRVFKIEKVIPYSKKVFKKTDIKKANITTRNFPENVNEIRKKFNIKAGGDNYLFFTTNNIKERIVIICKKTKKDLC